MIKIQDGTYVDAHAVVAIKPLAATTGTSWSYPPRIIIEYRVGDLFPGTASMVINCASDDDALMLAETIGAAVQAEMKPQEQS